MKKILLISLVALVATVSCKKKDPKKEEETPTTTAGNPGPTTATSFSGISQRAVYTSSSMGITTAVTSARAYFSSEPAMFIGDKTSVTVGSVFLNGDSLYYQSFGPYYMSNTATVNTSTQSWSVTGANGVPSFTYTDNTAMPVHSGLILPDNISKSAGFSVIISNLANMTSGSIILMDPNSPNPTPILKILRTGNNSINFSASELASLNSSTMAILNVDITNSRAMNISGKNFQFNKQAVFTKFIKIEN